jgi:alpha-tubulin suppressor-like RCC1 family protein
MALMIDGTVMAVGYNTTGQLGIGSTTQQNSWVTSGTISGVASIVCGRHHTMALMTDGTVKGVGRNNYGQLGIGNTTDQNSWVTSNITGVASIVCGFKSYHPMALMSDGTVMTVGQNEQGQLGIGTIIDTSSWVTSGIQSTYSTAFNEPNGTVDSISSISLANTATINSLAITESKPAGTDIKYALSFDGKTTWNTPSGVITDIATDGVSATILATYDFTGFSGTTLDIGVYLSTTDTSVSPTVDQITVGMTLNGYFTQIVVDGDKLQASESGTHTVTITNADTIDNIYKISVGSG